MCKKDLEMNLEELRNEHECKDIKHTPEGGTRQQKDTHRQQSSQK